MYLPSFFLYIIQGCQISMYVWLYVHVFTHVCRVLREKNYYFIPVHTFLPFLVYLLLLIFYSFLLPKMFIFSSMYTLKNR